MRVLSSVSEINLFGSAVICAVLYQLVDSGVKSRPASS